MDYTAMDQYWIWLSSVEGLGPKRFYQLMSEYEDARSVWDNVGEQMRFLGKQTYQNLLSARTEQYLYSLFATLDQKGIRAISRLSDFYPSRLTDIYDPPPVLYTKGDPSLLSEERLFAVVGTRRPTHDGKRAAYEISEGLARQGVTVVSGMARGIDTCAHTGALRPEDGRTVAVLGCGVDVVYPPENDKLEREILDRGGCVVSEYTPGAQPLPGNFPQRNRIISGLCPGALIVEAAPGSGAMITANLALDQNRDVFVVPGSIYSNLSIEPNRLLLTGAAPVLSAWDILEHYRWAERSDPGAKKEQVSLTDEERAIVEPLLSEALSFDEIAQKVEFPSNRLNSLLTMLELRGIISKVPGGYYRAK